MFRVYGNIIEAAQQGLQMLLTKLACAFFYRCKNKLMGVEGLEPSRLISQQILSLLCLPFHHTPKFKATPRFELGIEDLQSTALPLGHIALLNSTNNSLH